jgi:hypothetical protein
MAERCSHTTNLGWYEQPEPCPNDVLDGGDVCSYHLADEDAEWDAAIKRLAEFRAQQAA